jgi:RNA polymerase sigma-70 factor (ECF subfamily)
MASAPPSLLTLLQPAEHPYGRRLHGEESGIVNAAPAEPLDDAALVAALVRGDRGSLALLYDRHARILLAVALRILGDRGRAEDLLHDVFLEAWHHGRDFDPSRGSVRAWLVARTRSRALDRRAALQRHVRLAQDARIELYDPAPPDEGASPDRARVRSQVADLPSELAAVIDLAYFDGLSASEIASHLAIPIGTVKSRMARALAVLKQRLGAGEDGQQ